MASLDSSKLDTALTKKLGCERSTDGDHYRFKLYDGNGTLLGRTKISHGPKHTIDSTLVKLMSDQIGLKTSKNLVQFVACTLSKKDALKIIKAAE